MRKRIEREPSQIGGGWIAELFGNKAVRTFVQRQCNKYNNNSCKKLQDDALRIAG